MFGFAEIFVSLLTTRCLSLAADINLEKQLHPVNRRIHVFPGRPFLHTVGEAHDGGCGVASSVVVLDGTRACHELPGNGRLEYGVGPA